MRELITATGSHALIEVDGGVNLQTAPSLIEAGADVLVAGNAVFKADDMIGTIHQLKNMKYFLIAGEASGDLHASNLMAALKEQDAEADFRFLGGDLMQQSEGRW